MPTAARTTPRSRPVLALGPDSAGIPRTKTAFRNARLDEHHRYELIQGVLIVSPIPSRQERGSNEYLGHLLLLYQESTDGAALDGTMAEEEIDMGTNLRKVDRALWTGLGHPPTPADLPSVAVEFVSKGKRNVQRDYIQKRGEYMAAGVKEYWVFNRFEKTMTVFTKHRGKIRERVFREGDVSRTPLLPGFELPLARLFAVADNWQ